MLWIYQRAAFNGAEKYPQLQDVVFHVKHLREKYVGLFTTGRDNIIIACLLFK